MTLVSRSFGACSLVAALLFGGATQAGQVMVAVAANFTEAAEEIGSAFEAATGHEVTYSFGSTGQLYTQITQGAPFEVFLAADQARPEKAVTDGLAVPDTRFTYAEGRLVLWSADPALIADGPQVLSNPDLDHVAIADPATAPYGAAAVEALQGLGLYAELAPKLVQGKSITQTYQFVVTGNAPVGFVALSQVVNDHSGSSWIVPAQLYAPISQDAVLLKTGEGNDAATAYLDFLKSPEARGIIEGFGYSTGSKGES